MAFRRGFKTEANSLALETRTELGLGVFDALNPRTLAELLEIPIVKLTEVASDNPKIKYLVDIETDVFSAATVFDGRRRCIVYNDTHSVTRQNSSIAHELAHGILQHPKTPPLDQRGCRIWNQGIEDEATYLGSALLVTEAATLAIAKGKWSKQEAAKHFAVSPQLLQYRLNATGAYMRIKRLSSARR